MKYFNVIGANGEDIYHMRVYLVGKFDMLQEGLCYKFTNLVEKTSSELWVTSGSTIAYTSLVETTEGLNIPPLPENTPKDGQSLKLSEALKSPSKSVVSGKIVKVSPAKLVQDGTLSVKSIILKDSSSTAKICLFGQNAETDFQEGNTIEVTSVYPKMYQNCLQLTSTSSTNCQFLPEEGNIPDLTDEERKHWDQDSDFKDSNDNNDYHKMITLTDMLEVDLYSVCAKESCRQKKMKDNTCPTCHGSDIKDEKYFKATFLYTTDMKEDHKITLFKSTIQSILQTKVECNTKSQLIQYLVEKLPIEFSACISPSNAIYNIRKM